MRIFEYTHRKGFLGEKVHFVSVQYFLYVDSLKVIKLRRTDALHSPFQNRNSDNFIQLSAFYIEELASISYIFYFE